MSIEDRRDAANDIRDEGQALTLVWTSAATYNTATATTSQTATTVNSWGVLLPLDKARKVDDTMIVAGDETLLLSALDDTGAAYEPKVNGIITLADGSKRTLIAIDTLAPAGLTIMFDCVVRRLP